MRAITKQAVTQISFNPKHFMTLVMTGPDCRLEYCKIERTQFVDQEDENITEMRSLVGERANITAHHWSSDGDYFAICTEDAQICVYKIDFEILFSHQYRQDPRGIELLNLANIQMHEHGFVVGSTDGHFLFYEFSDEDRTRFSLVRNWQYEDEQIEVEE